MITPSEEDKLADACQRLKERSEAIRKALTAIGIALGDIEMDCSICGQFIPPVSAAATKLRRAAQSMRPRLNGLDPAAVWLQASRLAEAAWEGRFYEPSTLPKVAD